MVNVQYSKQHPSGNTVEVIATRTLPPSILSVFVTRVSEGINQFNTFKVVLIINFSFENITFLYHDGKLCQATHLTQPDSLMGPSNL